jgi:hypothetical protein
MPEDPAAGLPPEGLRRLQFARLFVEELTHPALRHPEAATMTASAPPGPPGGVPGTDASLEDEDEEEVRGVYPPQAAPPPPAAARPAAPQRRHESEEEDRPRRRAAHYEEEAAEYAPRSGPDWKSEPRRKSGHSWLPWLILALLALIALLAGLRFWNVF